MRGEYECVLGGGGGEGEVKNTPVRSWTPSLHCTYTHTLHITHLPQPVQLFMKLFQAVLSFFRCKKKQKCLHCFRVTVFTVVLNKVLPGPDSVPRTMLGTEGVLLPKPGPGQGQKPS